MEIGALDVAIFAKRRIGAMALLLTKASLALETGTPLCAKARRIACAVAPGERTMTAISRHGTPSMRWALRN